ncbi:MAG: PQQ-binding-like beta-propeller repeat protein, partial [Myxococcales bacterium]|nr:PQQ-binding-like beta-propeller repeat protein [Myxococcales bacterium]
DARLGPPADPTITSAWVNAALLADGALYAHVGLPTGTLQGQARQSLVAFDPRTGDLLPFAPTVVPISSITHLAAHRGVVYVVNERFVLDDDRQRYGVVALDAATGALLDWAPSFTNENQQPARLTAVAAAEGVVYVAGEFVAVDGEARAGLAAFDVESGALLPFAPDADLGVVADVIFPRPDRVLIVGERGRRVHVRSLEPATGATQAWAAELPEMADEAAVALEGDTLVVAGRAPSLASAAPSLVVTVDLSTGEVDPLPTPLESALDSAGRIRAVAIDRNRIVYGGRLAILAGVARPYLAAMDLATGEVLAWRPFADPADGSAVRALAMQGSTLYVGGDFTRVGEALRANLAAFDLDTLELLPWNPRARGSRVREREDSVTRLLARPEGVYAMGDFYEIGDEDRSQLARIDPVSGEVDAWSPLPSGPLTTHTLYDLCVHRGELLLSGVVAGVDRTIHALDLETGERRTFFDPPSPGALVCGDGFVATRYSDNQVAVLDPDSGEVTMRFVLTDRFVDDAGDPVANHARV